MKRLIFLAPALLVLGLNHVAAQPKNLSEALEMAAQKINRQSPIRIDEYTIMTGAVGGLATLTYYYSVSFSVPPEDRRSIGDRTKAGRLQEYCVEMRPALNAGATVEHRYTDKQGFVYKFSVSKKDCR
jgi:hypothetical protein